MQTMTGLAECGGGGDDHDDDDDGDDDVHPCCPDLVSGRAGQWTALGSGRSWSTPARHTRRSPVARATWSPMTWCVGSPATLTS